MFPSVANSNLGPRITPSSSKIFEILNSSVYTHNYILKFKTEYLLKNLNGIGIISSM